MRESRSYGSVRGALSDEHPYRELTLPVITHQPSGAGMKVTTDIIASDSASLPHLHYLLHTNEANFPAKFTASRELVYRNDKTKTTKRTAGIVR
jgi:hypothetical protein